jgi:hypothetical protein
MTATRRSRNPFRISTPFRPLDTPRFPGPEGTDAFIAWNFFDSALQQKEYFSSYVFEETAQSMLNADPALKTAFEAEKTQQGQDWSSRAQLDWLYKRSPHFEGTASRYPIFSIPKGQPIPFDRP